MMRKRIFTILQYLIFLGLGVFLVWWSARNIDEQGWKNIRDSLKDARYWLFAPVLLILFLSHWLRALRWRVLMEPMGYVPRKSNTFFAVMIGYLANLAVPRLGEVLKCTLLARYEKVPAEKLVGTMIAERAVDVISLLIVFLAATLLQSNIIGVYIQQLFADSLNVGDNMRWVVVLIVVGSLLLLIFVTWFMIRRFPKVRLIINIRKILKGIWQGLMSIRYVKRKGLFFLYSVAIWLLYYGGTYLGFFALEETSGYDYKVALSVLAFGSVGMIMTQGGIGAYQLMVQQTMLLYGLEAEIGFAFGCILWVAQTFVILLFGLISFGMLPYYNKKRDESSRQDSR